MAVHLQIRDLPDELHQQLRQRAAARGLSLRQYALEILSEHCRRPTVDEWLDGLSRLPTVALSTPAAEAVRQAREADDAALAKPHRRP
jgi:antitoxin FitA